MNLKDIVDLCKAGRAEEAYDEAHKLLASDFENRYARIGSAYAIKALMENAAAAANTDTAFRLLNEYADLRLDQIDEQEMNNRIIWAVRSLILSWKDAGMDVAKNETLFESLKRINFLKPHRYYSVLLDSLLKLKDRQGNQWIGLASVIEWWGLCNLLEEDYKRTLLTNGQPMPSLAERAYTAAIKSLLVEVVTGNMIEEAEQFLVELDALEQVHPEYTGILYQKSHLLKAMGREGDALEAARAFVRRRPSEYWAWSALGDVAETDEDRAACYCRALKCKVNPAFQGKVRYKLAVALYTLGEFEYARREFEKIVKFYNQRGWHLPGNLEEIMRQQWYEQTVPAEFDRDYYDKLAARAEQYLNNDNPETPVMISNYNPQKHTAGYVTADHKRGFFLTRNLPGEFANYQILLVRFDGEIGGGKSTKVISCRRVEDTAPYEGVFYRRIVAPAGLRPGQSFLFVEDIYIEANLLTGIEPDTECEVTAILYYNIKRDSWGWRAIRVRPV